MDMQVSCVSMMKGRGAGRGGRGKKTMKSYHCTFGDAAGPSAPPSKDCSSDEKTEARSSALSLDLRHGADKATEN